jgi:hypothetical protein
VAAQNRPQEWCLARQKSRFTHDYFYIRDEILGPFVMRVATFFPFQTTYYLNGHSFIVGNPCPFLLIGLPSSIVTFGEPAAVVEALLKEGADEE